MKQPSIRYLWILVLTLGLIALACNFPGMGGEETTDSDATTTPLVVPGSTPTASLAPGATSAGTPAASPTPAATDEVCNYRAAFVKDVTIPDDTQIQPGTAFTKTWRLRNSGTCAWEEGAQLIHVSGDEMGTVDTVSVPATAPEAEIEISVPMQAPADPGTYRSDWQLVAASGKRFGGVFYAQIVVPGEVTTSPTPLPQTPSPPHSFLGSVTPDCKRVTLTWITGQGQSAHRLEGAGLNIALDATANSYVWDNPPAGLTTVNLITLDKDDKEVARLKTTVGVHCGSEQPDLVVVSVTFVPTTPVAHLPVTATVRVKNQGDAGSGAFISRWWAIKSAPQATCEWVVSEGLEAGKTVDVTCTGLAYSSVYASLLTAAQVDASGIIQEKEEQNNRLETEISVVNPESVYNFVEEASTAAWIGGPPAAPLPWSGNAAEGAGYARWSSDTLETGSALQTMCLEMHPKQVENGIIRGEFQDIGTPEYVIQPGDHFRATVGMLQGATQGNVTYRVMLILSQSGGKWIATESHAYGEGIKILNVDLTPYAGQSAVAILEVAAGSSAVDDRACWIEAQIYRYP